MITFVNFLILVNLQQCPLFNDHCVLSAIDQSCTEYLNAQFKIWLVTVFAKSIHGRNGHHAITRRVWRGCESESGASAVRFAIVVVVVIVAIVVAAA